MNDGRNRKSQPEHFIVSLLINCLCVNFPLSNMSLDCIHSVKHSLKMCEDKSVYELAEHSYLINEKRRGTSDRPTSRAPLESNSKPVTLW
ncbi:unnamed protein product [Leptosia nina]|uniref:Uncharacterized protein n=1 Tax=Leptosia nina TaxID=320188 RepID=A0AAV1J1H8_9NEOP